MRYVFYVLAGLSCLFTTTIQASTFHTAIDALYTVDPSGITKVKETYHITNNTGDLFVSEYTIQVGHKRLKNLEALSGNNNLIPVNQITNEGNAQIKLNFPDQVVGKGKTREFILTYTALDIASKNGSVLQVSIPKVISGELPDDYRLTLLVPVEFGQPALLSPSPDEMKTDPVYRKIVYQHTNVLQSGISAFFGDKQTYRFAVTYHLENSTITPVETQIALPPDTNYQRLYYERISPSPQALDHDGDGNWIATYNLDPKAKIDITAAGYTTIYPLPNHPIPHFLSNEAYVKADKYWEVDDEAVKKIAIGLDSPQSIYDYVVKTLSYNQSRLTELNPERLGALAALKQPTNALCQEFTDTFITLARAKHIPTRLLLGYAYTNNPTDRPVSLVKDTLHTWVEYFDAQTLTWKAIDPTWGHTTAGLDYFHSLDFSHFVFAIQGISSTKPYPAGFYPGHAPEGRTISVEVSEIQPADTFLVDQATLSLSKMFFTQGAKGELSFFNLSNTALYQPQLHLLSANESEITVTAPDIILPFSHVTMPVEAKTVPENGKEMTLAIGSYQTTIRYANHQKVSPVVYVAITLILVSFASFIIPQLRRVLVSRRKR